MMHDICVICKKGFTAQEQNAGEVQMFLMDNCYHQFHLPCFHAYAKKALLTKGPKGDYLSCSCAHCGTIVDEANLSELLGPELNKIREM